MKKYTHWLALLVIFLWLPISAFAQNERVWQQRIDEGKAAMGDGQYAQAEDSFRNALVEALLFGRDDRKVGVSAYNIAEALSEQGRSIEAKQLYTKALHILEEKDGPDSPTVASVLIRQGVIATSENRMSAAESAFGRALPIVRRSWDKNDSELIRLEYLVALLELTTLHYEKADRGFADVIPRMEELYGSKTHEEVLEAKRFHASALKKLGRETEAALILNEVDAVVTSDFTYEPVLKPALLQQTQIFVSNKVVDPRRFSFLEDDVLVSREILAEYLSNEELKLLSSVNGKVVYDSVIIFEQIENDRIPLFRLLQAAGLKAYHDPQLGTIDFLRPSKMAQRPEPVVAKNTQGSTSGYSYSSSSYSGYSSYSGTGGGSVYVRGYYRKDGTYVRPHTRSRPTRR